jgi:hypothetical protein
MSWSLEPDLGLFTVADYSLTTSERLASRRNVRGVQFATQQTPAQQRLIDPDFNDLTLSYWMPYMGASIETSADLNTDIGTTIRVTRTPNGSYWNYLEHYYATPGVPWSTWDAIENSDPGSDPDRPDWDDMEDAAHTITDSEGGVESVDRVDMPVRGRMYAAARVYTVETLHAPLHLQIVGEGYDGHIEVLSDEAAVASPGQVVEWYTYYTVGEGGDPLSSNTWDQIEAMGTVALGGWNAIEAGEEVLGGPEDPATSLVSWNDLEFPGTTTGFSGWVYPRLVQTGTTTDEWYVDNISIYEDPIIWEFSNDSGVTWYPVYDIRNNPDGVFMFPDVVAETTESQAGTALVWRVFGYRPNLHITSLLIRPWYSSLHLGVAPKMSLEYGGPNQTPYDHYPSVADSAPFKLWHKPIPEDWWFSYRQWLLQEFRMVVLPPEAPQYSPGVQLVEAIVLI